MRVFAVIGWALIGLVAMSVARAEDVSASLRHCRTLSDAAPRLACYDAIVIDAAESAATAPQPALSAEQRFGLPAATVLHKEAERGAAPQEMATLALKITSLSFGAGGRVVIGLENGQVWQQLTPSSDLELLKLGDRVEISRGLLGSFWLSGPGKRGAKVTRVR